MKAGARDVVELVSAAALEFAAEAAYGSRVGTVARLAAEAADEDAYLVTVPAVEVFGAHFRDHLCGFRRTGRDTPDVERVEFGWDTEVVVRFLRRSPDDEWLILECVPRDGGTRCRRALTDDDEVSGRLRAALVTYGFRGHPEGVAALRRSLERGALRWLPTEWAAARATGTFTPRWWGDLLYPGGLWPDDTETVAADLAAIDAATAPLTV